MIFEDAMALARSGFHVKRKGWNLVNMCWTPGATHIQLYWLSGFVEDYRPTLDDIESRDWEASFSNQEPRLHQSIHNLCKNLDM